MNRMNYLAQLALMLQGGGMGDQYSPSDDPYQSASDAWSSSYGSLPGSHLPVTPVQEFMLGTSPFEIFGSRPMAIPRPMPFPFPGEWSDPIPRWNPIPRAIPDQPRFPIPQDIPLPPPFPVPRKRRRDNMFGFPDGSTETPTFPPYNSPFPIPDTAPGGGPLLPPITDPITPYNPSFEKPFHWEPHYDPDEEEEENWPIPKEEPCRSETLDAIDFCRREIRKVKSLRSEGHFGVTFGQCMRGQLSEGCGGNAPDKSRNNMQII
jgi:hypothetical protein